VPVQPSVALRERRTAGSPQLSSSSGSELPDACTTSAVAEMLRSRTARSGTPRLLAFGGGDSTKLALVEGVMCALESCPDVEVDVRAELTSPKERSETASWSLPS
jgi:hypothetical protein